jgi:ketosteroid isomerase-like protein
MRGLQERFREVIDDLWFEPEDFVRAGNQVLVPVRWGGRGRGSGVTVEECAEAWVFTVEDGAITNVQEYASKKAALEAFPVSQPGGHTGS